MVILLKILSFLEVIVKAPTLFTYSVAKWLKKIDNHKVFQAVVAQEVVCIVVMLSLYLTDDMNILAWLVFVVVILIVVPFAGYMFVGQPHTGAQWNYVIKGNKELFEKKYKKQIAQIRGIEEKKKKKIQHVENKKYREVTESIVQGMEKDNKKIDEVAGKTAILDKSIVKEEKEDKVIESKYSGSILRKPFVPDSRYEFDEDEAEEKKKDVLNQEISDDEANSISNQFDSFSVDDIIDTSELVEGSIESSVREEKLTSDGYIKPNDVGLSAGEHMNIEVLNVNSSDDICDIDIDVSPDQINDSDILNDVMKNNIDADNRSAEKIESTVGVGFLGSDVDDDECI